MTRFIEDMDATPRRGFFTRMAGAMASYFEKNQGQTDPSVKYLSRSGRYSMFLTDDATTVISMVGG